MHQVPRSVPAILLAASVVTTALAPGLGMPVSASTTASGLAAALPSGTTTRVSVGPGAVQADGSSQLPPAISADGNVVAFLSFAANLVSDDTNSTQDAFIHDRRTGVTRRVSVNDLGAQASGPSVYPISLSADGRYVVFTSFASDLVEGDTNASADVFVRDTVAGTTRRVSVKSDGAEANTHSSQPAISADARFVVFSSFASNLVAGDTNGQDDVFIHDVVTGTTELVSVNSAGLQASDRSFDPAISAEGRYVAFASQGRNLDPRVLNQVAQVYVRDRQEGTTTLVSLDAQGGPRTFFVARFPAISGDGQLIAFQTGARLTAEDRDSAQDVYLRDMTSGTTRLVSRTTSIQQVQEAASPAISLDGSSVAFHGRDSGFVDGDTNNATDVFVFEVATGALTRASVSTEGVEGNVASLGPALSRDGRLVAFYSASNNLVPDDTNSRSDVFVRDRAPKVKRGFIFVHGINGDFNDHPFGSLMGRIEERYLDPNGEPLVDYFRYHQDLGNRTPQGCEERSLTQVLPYHDTLGYPVTLPSPGEPPYCDSNDDVGVNGLFLEADIRRLRARWQVDKITLIANSMGGAIVRAYLAYAAAKRAYTGLADTLDIVDGVVFLQSVHQGAYGAAVKGFVDESPILQPIRDDIADVVRDTFHLDPDRPALDDLAPRSEMIRFVNRLEHVPTELHYINARSDIRLRPAIGLLGFRFPVTVPVGDYLLLPGDQDPTTTPAGGGAGFLPSVVAVGRSSGQWTLRSEPTVFFEIAPAQLAVLVATQPESHVAFGSKLSELCVATLKGTKRLDQALFDAIAALDSPIHDLDLLSFGDLTSQRCE